MSTLSQKGRKEKGSKAEREVAAILHDLTGKDVRRTLAGHSDDIGDLSGLPSVTLQVKNYEDVTRAIREGLSCLEEQQARSGDPFGALWVRRRGGSYVVCMTPEQFAALWREATNP